MKIKQMIIHSNLSKMKNKILPTCLQGNYRDSLGEFNNTRMSYGMFRAERVGKSSRYWELNLIIKHINIKHSSFWCQIKL